jgi:probable rRNA maturation factor
MKVLVRNRQRAHKVDAARVQGLATEALTLVRSTFETLGIILVSDREMARLNQQFHQTAGTTDILTFDYGGGEGELIISIPRAVEQARQYGTTRSRELALYVVHGILHLHGHDDTRAAARRRMRRAEQRLLGRLDFQGLLPVR